MLEFREETLDPVTAAVGIAIQRRRCRPSRDRADDGPGANAGQPVAQAVAVVGGVGEQGLTRPDRAQQVIG